MFKLFRPRLKPPSPDEYLKKFHRLTREVGSQFSVGDAPYEQLVDSMSVIENEMNRNGGGNWQEEDYIEYLDTIRDHLTIEASFTPEQTTKIHWSLNEIHTCGRELEQAGESYRNATDAVNYLIARVVDWCERHPRGNDEA